MHFCYYLRSLSGAYLALITVVPGHLTVQCIILTTPMPATCYSAHFTDGGSEPQGGYVTWQIPHRKPGAQQGREARFLNSGVRHWNNHWNVFPPKKMVVRTKKSYTGT